MTPTKDLTNEQLNDIMAMEAMEWVKLQLGGPFNFNSYAWYKDGKFIIYCKHYSPTTNLTQAMECFDKIDNTKTIIGLSDKSYGVNILRGGYAEADILKDLPLAIVRACAEAVRAK